MKWCMLGCLMGCGVSLVQAEPQDLKPVDVQELLSRLEEMENGAKGRTEGRLGAARTAFTTGVQSDGAALDLYFKCVEKVRYEDADRSSQEFREWKRRSKDRFGPEFRRALRHELNWLLLTIEAAGSPAKIPTLGAKGMEKLDQMVKDLPEMGPHKDRLKESVLNSVFATTYGLGGIRLEGWPLAPLKVKEVYEELVLPPLRKPATIGALKSAWMKRIEQEERLIAPAADEGDRLGKNLENVAKLEVFLIEKRPNLLWEMEVDLFKAGDQRGAAVRMVGHIEKNLGHKDEERWISEFRALIGAKESEE
jgi:hypothetical protein